jgi:hypothetical protein
MKSLLVLCALASLAGAAEAPTERGKRVIQEALQALGGDAYLHMQDRLETGRLFQFYNQGLSGTDVARIYTRYLAPAPGKASVREREAFGKKQEDGAALFTEDGAWEITFRGARPIPDERYANFQDGTLRNVFYILRQRLNEPGMQFYSMGSDFFENRPVEIVDITDASTATVTVFFDQSTKLPVRQVFKRRNPDYKDFDTEVTIFAKFRDVGGGVKWPFGIRRERNGLKIYEMFSDSVEINKDLKDDLFTLPGNVKVLPKDK